MNHYIHYVSGFFEHRAEADDAFNKIIAQGLPDERVQLHTHHLPTRESTEGSNEVLKDVLEDGAIGVATGAGLGALIEVAMVATNVSLFIASPLIAPLALLGWGASVGGLLGASIGATKNAKPLSALIEDAIKSGQIVLVVETRTAEETTIAKEVIKGLIGDYKENDVA